MPVGMFGQFSSRLGVNIFHYVQRYSSRVLSRHLVVSWSLLLDAGAGAARRDAGRLPDSEIMQILTAATRVPTNIHEPTRPSLVGPRAATVGNQGQLNAECNILCAEYTWGQRAVWTRRLRAMGTGMPFTQLKEIRKDNYNNRRRRISENHSEVAKTKFSKLPHFRSSRSYSSAWWEKHARNYEKSCDSDEFYHRIQTELIEIWKFGISIYFPFFKKIFDVVLHEIFVLIMKITVYVYENLSIQTMVDEISQFCTKNERKILKNHLIWRSVKIHVSDFFFGQWMKSKNFQ